MKAVIFLIVILPFALLLTAQFKETPEHLKTEKEKLVDLLEDLTFNTPKEIIVLSNEDHFDPKTRVTIKTLILKTNEEYLPKSPPISNKAKTVLETLKTDLPEHDFGEPKSTQAHSFRWLTPSSEWLVSSVETSYGHFSRWKKTTDVHQLSRDE